MSVSNVCCAWEVATGCGWHGEPGVGESSAVWLFLEFGRWECEDGGDSDAFNIFTLQKLDT